jgi:hypothetical protein
MGIRWRLWLHGCAMLKTAGDRWRKKMFCWKNGRMTDNGFVLGDKQLVIFAGLSDVIVNSTCQFGFRLRQGYGGQVAGLCAGVTCDK